MRRTTYGIAMEFIYKQSAALKAGLEHIPPHSLFTSQEKINTLDPQSGRNFSCSHKVGSAIQTSLRGAPDIMQSGLQDRKSVIFSYSFISFRLLLQNSKHAANIYFYLKKISLQI